MKVETIKKTQKETTLETENLGKKSGAIDASINKRIEQIEERISGSQDPGTTGSHRKLDSEEF
jgi:hypothetical protein